LGTLAHYRRSNVSIEEIKMKNSMTKRISAFIICTLAFAASACHTVEGVGKDLESAGDKAEEITKN
jgi:predicted small secreted protein